jgi:hypothetical protein
LSVSSRRSGARPAAARSRFRLSRRLCRRRAGSSSKGNWNRRRSGRRQYNFKNGFKNEDGPEGV